MTRNRSLLLLAAFPCCLSAQTSTADCAHALFVCDKNPLLVQALPDAGQQDESATVPCLTAPLAETNSIWLTWQVAEAGTLEFSILPDDPKNDLDFVLYRLKSPGDCTDKEALRCMAAGPSLGQAESPLNTCTGATGLRSTSAGSNQSSGCAAGTDNFLSPAEVQQGERYALWINNFRSKGGVTVEWGGTVVFQPVPTSCQPTSDAPAPIAEVALHLSDPFPNPTNDRVYIRLSSDRGRNGQVELLHVNGQIERSTSFDLPPGGGLIELPVTALNPGVWFVRVRTGDAVHLAHFCKQ